jgi:hypothetical protein
MRRLISMETASGHWLGAYVRVEPWGLKWCNVAHPDCYQLSVRLLAQFSLDCSPHIMISVGGFLLFGQATTSLEQIIVSVSGWR